MAQETPKPKDTHFASIKEDDEYRSNSRADRRPANPGDDLPVPDVGFDPEDLEMLLEWEMPFGRFAGCPLIDLPEEYLMWFAQREFPEGDLGRLMRLCYGIKIHGADNVVKQLRHRLRELEGS